MSGVKFLLDTNIIIGLLNRHASVLALISELNFCWEACAFSAITRMELLSYHSITEQEMSAIEQLLARMTYLPIDHDIEAKTIHYRRANRGKLPDAIVAATAQVHQLTLITLDQQLKTKV